jgi:hypothetical protein
MWLANSSNGAGRVAGHHRFYDPNENPIKEAKQQRRKAIREAVKSGNGDAFDAAYAMPDPPETVPGRCMESFSGL